MKLICFLEVDTTYHEKCLNCMLKSVSPEKKEKLMKYRFDIDRKIGIYADVLLRLIIIKAAGISYGDIAFATGESGKPYLKCTPSLEFNVSHTRTAIAAALADRPVGIDVERIRKTDIQIAREVFSDNELKHLNSEASDRYRKFFDIWTKKEAVIKCDGHGLSDDMKRVDTTRCQIPKNLFTMYLGDYVVSVCSEAKFKNADVITITEAKLIDMWCQHCTQDIIYANGE